jgi:hypothetical protein
VFILKEIHKFGRIQTPMSLRVRAALSVSAPPLVIGLLSSSKNSQLFFPNHSFAPKFNKINFDTKKLFKMPI